jgi:hypothetical protein
MFFAIYRISDHSLLIEKCNLPANIHIVQLAHLNERCRPLFVSKRECLFNFFHSKENTIKIVLNFVIDRLV